MKLFFIMGAAVLTFALAACGGVTPQQQTLQAQNDTLLTQIADLETTVTVNADRLQITIEYVNTDIARVGTQQSRLIATLQERGFDLEEMSGVIAAIQATGVPAVATSVNPTSVPITPQGAVPASPAPPPEETPNAPGQPQPTLSQIVMAQGVDSNDCATNVTNQFSPTAERIYVVARATNVQPGTLIRSRWVFNDNQLAAFDFTPDFTIQNACIWFFADQTDFPFTPGTYIVFLELGGQPSGEISYTIAGN